MHASLGNFSFKTLMCVINEWRAFWTSSSSSETYASGQKLSQRQSLTICFDEWELQLIRGVLFIPSPPLHRGAKNIFWKTLAIFLELSFMPHKVEVSLKIQNSKKMVPPYTPPVLPQEYKKSLVFLVQSETKVCARKQKKQQKWNLQMMGNWKVSLAKRERRN